MTIISKASDKLATGRLRYRPYLSAKRCQSLGKHASLFR